MIQAIARVVLIFVDALFRKPNFVDLTINPSDICWEPDLQAAESLYDKPGAWSVDEACVTTLQAMDSNMIRKLLNVPLRSMLAVSFSKLGVFGGGLPLLDGWKHRLAEGLLSFFDETWDQSLQRYVYPYFKRFLRHSKQRNNDNTTVSVSCQGLRGVRRHVHFTVVQLLRLVIVNELRYRKHRFFPTLVAVFASHFIPCLVNYVI